MKSPATVLAVPALALSLFPVFALALEMPKPALADVIVTSAPSYLPLAAFGAAGKPALPSGERFPKGAQLQLIHDGKAESLVKGFAATADAQVSFDGKSVLFAGKQNAADPWQIWEVRLNGRTVRRIVTAVEDVVRPFYLPFGRLVYARRGPQGFYMETAALPGYRGPDSNVAASDVVRITYLPGSTLPTGVLADGRILFEAANPMGTGTSPELYLVYSDGSGVESYRCDHGTARWDGTQFSSGDVIFTHGTSLARFTSPLAHEERVNAPHAEYAGSPAETPNGAWLLSARSTSSAHYQLKSWKVGTPALQTVLASADADLVEPVVVAEHERPRQHPTALHPWSYANLLALDARESREGNLKALPKSVRLETLDAAGKSVVTGTAPIEQDGSFFVQVPGDKPIRFSLLDEKGAVVRQEHGWFWIRAGEQRICVGCHAGPERASENTVPAVLLRTIVPVDLTGTAKSQVQKTPGGK